jgi:hypothetical protein
VDGTLAGNAEAPVTTPFVLNPGALTCGANPGSAVTDEYASPFKFTGTIHSVTVDVSGKLIQDPEAARASGRACQGRAPARSGSVLGLVLATARQLG